MCFHRFQFLNLLVKSVSLSRKLLAIVLLLGFDDWFVTLLSQLLLDNSLPVDVCFASDHNTDSIRWQSLLLDFTVCLVMCQVDVTRKMDPFLG